jgi:hypothetical protein
MASATLIRASDSMLVSFSRAKADGSFELKTDSARAFLLLVTFPGFADYIDYVKTDDRAIVELGNINMFTREKVFDEFVLHQKSGAIKIKGDTTEYVADSFKVGANANVEELLRRLPGLQVDKNGQVTAQGEVVKKILVDGEEFFSDDPAVVNKNLQAKTIDKVQIFDKKSEQAEFTGIDDGQRTKTINLTMKDKYKKGFFGKVALGGGTDEYFENQGMINFFRGKKQLSIFGIAANTGKVGLGWEDRDKFGEGNNMTASEDGYMFSNYTGDDEDASWDGKYHGQGLPKAWTGGVHFADKWNEDKHHLSSNYRFARQNLETVNNTFTQTNLPDSAYYTNQNSTSFSSTDRHRIDGLYEWKYDSLSVLKLTANAGYMSRRNNNYFNTNTQGQSGSLMNDGVRSTSNDGITKSLNTSLIWKKKFHKQGRSLIMQADLNNRNQDNNGMLSATNHFYTGGGLDSTSYTDQRKESDQNTLSLSASANYTEPLSKKTFLEVNYKYTKQNNESKQYSFNKDGADSYSLLDSTFSSNYRYDVDVHRAGAAMRFVYEKVNFSFGGAVSNTAFLQTDQFRDTSITRNYTNFFPSASFKYNFNKQSAISLNYNGETRQPTVDQIQPIRQNNDPLNISVGNPGLSQMFRNSIYFRYNSYKVLKGTYVYANAGTTFIGNDISRAEQITPTGMRTYQYVNVNGNYSAWGYGGAGYKIKKWDVDAGYWLSVNLSHVNNYVNGTLNKSDNNGYTLGGRFSYYKENKYNISFDPSVTYNDNKSTINTNNVAYWSTSQQLEGAYYLPKKFVFGTDISWNIRQRTAVFDRNNNVFQWNAYIYKKLLKNESLEVRASVFDILNQNLGFSRYGQNNQITQQTYNTIRRYGMLTLSWNFTKSPAVKEEPADGADMILTK